MLKRPGSRWSLLLGFPLVASLAAQAAAQWSTDAAANLAIVSKSGEQVTPKIAATPDGGC